MLYATPIKRGNVLVLDDFPVIHDVKVKLKVGGVKEIYKRPTDKKIRFTVKNGVTEFTVDKFSNHLLIEIKV